MKLSHAIDIAIKAHHGQKDKADMPYILHPMYIMSKMDTTYLKEKYEKALNYLMTEKNC